MPSCAFPSCTNHSKRKNKTHGITFHSFPGNAPLQHKWLIVVRRHRQEPDWTPNKHSRICSVHFKSQDMCTTNKGYRKLSKNAVPFCREIPVTSVTAGPSKSQLASDDDFTWPEPKREDPVRTLKRSAVPSVFPWNYTSVEQPSSSDQDILRFNPCQVKATYSRGKRSADRDDESDDGSDHFQDQDDTVQQDGIPEITEIKIEPPEEIDLDAVKTEPDPELLDTILGSDGGASSGFRPFVRATNLNLPRVNMFAVVEFIAGNDYYTRLHYDKLKDIASNNSRKLLSGLRVQNLEFVHRVRCTVHLHTSSQCGIEYDISTHTVTRSECMCACATCDHVAALLMWLHCVSNQKDFDAKLVPEDNKPHKTDTKITVMTHQNKPDTTFKKTQQSMTKVVKPVMVKRRDAGDVQTGVDDSEVSLNEPDDPLDVPELGDLLSDEELTGPSTAKRKKISPAAPRSYSATVFKTKSTPKDTDTKIDESIIKCSFTRKCFFNVWRSTKGNFHEKLRHTRSIMTKAFHDANYVIDFLPLEKKLEELCMEIEGYWSIEADRDGFETKYAEWFAVVENIDMKKTKRDPDPGPGSSFVAV